MTQYNENISYEIVENGYKIYLDGKLWIEQLDEYAKPYDANKSFEENCLAQLEDITRPAEASQQISLEDRVSDLEIAICELADLMA